MINKNNAHDVIATQSKRMVVTVMESKGGGVKTADALSAVEIASTNTPESRYGLNVG